jgi:hypothetical protein
MEGLTIFYKSGKVFLRQNDNRTIFSVDDVRIKFKVILITAKVVILRLNNGHLGCHSH